VYNTLSEAYKNRKKIASKTSLKESLGFGSKSLGTSNKVKQTKQVIEENDAFSRMRELAGKVLND
jgi:hypothetical protein